MCFRMGFVSVVWFRMRLMWDGGWCGMEWFRVGFVGVVWFRMRFVGVG